jgi:hypothetical protein
MVEIPKRAKAVAKKKVRGGKSRATSSRNQSDSPSAPFASLLYGSGSYAELANFRDRLRASNDLLDLSFGLQELRDLHSRTEAELKILNLRMQDQLRISSGLIKEFSDKVDLLAAAPPDFVQGSSGDINLSQPGPIDLSDEVAAPDPMVADPGSQARDSSGGQEN